MADLYVSLIVMFAFLALAFFAGRRVSGSPSRLRLLALQLGTILLIAAYLIWLWERPLLITLIPFSGAIILGNWSPLFATFLVGILSANNRISRIRRIPVVCASLTLCCYSLVCPVLGTAPPVPSTNRDRLLQFQTTDVTCSPCSAAALLRLHGIPSDEREMAELCLTRDGTHWLGVYRALRLKTEGTDWQVQVQTLRPGELSENRQCPAVLALSFTRQAGRGIGTDRFDGLVSGVGHSVLLLAQESAERLLVFDPAPEFGLEEWDTDVLTQVDSGVILRLVPRNARAAAVPDLQARLQQLKTERACD